MIKSKTKLLTITAIVLSLVLFKISSTDNTKSSSEEAINPHEIAFYITVDTIKPEERLRNIEKKVSGDNGRSNDNDTDTPTGAKENPVITCPKDITITCADDYLDLKIVGEATAVGSCGSMPVEYTDVVTYLGVCNDGYIKRRWNVVGVVNVTCDQIITLYPIRELASVSFVEVGDKEVSGCPDQNDFGEPSWTGSPCDVIGYTFQTDTFFFEDGACYKLVNNYTVINWCDYKPNDPSWVETDDFTDGLAEHTQIIKMMDQTKPVIVNCEDFLFEINDANDIDNDGNLCEAKIVLTNSATDPESAKCPSGWLKWQVFVDLWGDGTRDLEFSSFLPPSDSQFNDTNGNGIADIYIPPTESGEEVSISLPDIEGAISNHKVFWKVTDGCYNVTTCDYEILVLDRKAPTPFCVDSITVQLELNGQGQATLWATDLNIGSFDNCSSEENLRYTFSEVPPQDDPLYEASIKSSQTTFNGSDVFNSPVKVNMYVWDEKDNYDFCVVYVNVIGQIELTTSKISTHIKAERVADLVDGDISLIPEAENTLHQNQPNPFRNETIISFNLAKAGMANLTIMNADGSIVKSIKIEGEKGFNAYLLNENVIDKNGLYYYRLVCEGFMDMKKMINVR